MKNDFKVLSSRQAREVLFQAYKQKVEVQFWKKNQTTKFYGNIEFYNPTSNLLFIDDLDKSCLNTKLYLTFELNGLNYFSTVDKVTLENSEYFIHFTNNLFKRERRKSFRLQSSRSNLQILTRLNIEGYAQSSNVLKFNSAKSQTSLFKSFLSILNDNDENEIKPGLVSYVVHDISLGGFSLEAAPLDLDFFEVGQEVHRFYLKFQDDEIEINHAKIIYIEEIQEKESSYFRIGFEFVELSERSDMFIANHINEYIRNSDGDEFEDLIT